MQVNELINYIKTKICPECEINDFNSVHGKCLSYLYDDMFGSFAQDYTYEIRIFHPYNEIIVYELDGNFIPSQTYDIEALEKFLYNKTYREGLESFFDKIHENSIFR